MTTEIVPPEASVSMSDAASIAEFYASILPADGLRVLATFKNGPKAAPAHTFYGTNDELIDAAHKAGHQHNVFHGCATYLQTTSRKGENVAKVKSQWIDLDVGPNKPYASQSDALADITAFCAALELPPPWIVSSGGGGLHVYSPLTVEIPVEAWRYTAGLFADCLDHFGVKHDTSRTRDIASILRVPGSMHLKDTANPRPVEILQKGVPESPRTIIEKLRAYLTAAGIDPDAPPATGKAGKPRKGTTPPTSDLIGSQDYPPAVASLIEEGCAVITKIAATGGDVDYMPWFGAMGVAKHTTDPEATAAHWTRNRASTGHDKYDWQKTINEWPAGPTTCEKLSKSSPECGTCPHKGTIKSPIQLGHTTPNTVTALQPEEQQQVEQQLPDYVRKKNDRFVVGLVGNDFAVIDTQAPKVTAGGTTVGVNFMRREALVQMFAGELVEVGNRKINAGTAWMQHPGRRQYDAISFAPGENLGPKVFNLWRGFGVNAVPGDVDPWLTLLASLIPDPALRQHVLNWLAWKVQTPGGVPGTVLILAGGKGAGKNSLVEPVIQIFGAHGALYDDGEQVAGRFNLHLLDKAFVVLDEALFIGNAQQCERIKSRITATTMGYEGKGLATIQGVNRCAYVLLTNHRDVWPASADERRPIVVDVDSSLKGHTTFWRSYYAWIKDGGASALLAYLQQIDLTGFNVRTIPKTAGLQRQVVSTALKDPLTSWWYDCLSEGAVLHPQSISTPLSDTAPTAIPTQELQRSYEAAAKNRRGYSAGWSEAAKRLYELTGNPPQHRPTVNGIRTRVVELPAVNAMKAMFTAATGVDFLP